MALSLKPAHLKRYKDLVVLLLKHGKSDALKGADFELGEDFQPPTPEITAKAEELASDLEAMGPTFIKLGQLLSTRTDLFPPATIEALSRLRDKVEPVEGTKILQTIEDELGAKVSRLFPEFDLQPLAAASLGQVHRACLRDGREVVVKVQRPDIRRQVMEDMEALEQLAEVLDRHSEFAQRYRVRDILGDFRRATLQELDYRQEASHLVKLAANLKEFDRIIVPVPVEDLTTSRVLTMEYIHGFKVSSLLPVDRALIHGDELAEQLFQAYLKQILVDGFVHADPHPGNVFVTEEGSLALLDLGMITRLSAPIQNRLVTILLAIAEDRSDDLCEAVFDMVEPDESVDRNTFSRKVSDILGRFQDSTVKDIDIGRILVDLSRTAVDCGFFLPAEVGMIGQTLLKLDSVGRQLAPHFNTNEAIRKHVVNVLKSRVLRSQSLGSVFKGLLELKEFAAQFPRRLSRIMDVVGDNRLKVEVQAIDEGRLMEVLQKIANRITLGLVLAALIVGAALVLRIESRFRLFGYPGLPILLFGGAAVGILALIYTIVFKDVTASQLRAERRAKKPGRKVA